MGKLIGCLLKELIGFLLLVLLAPLIYSFLYEACSFLISNADFYLTNWFTYGFLFYILIYILILQYVIAFIETLEHELGHTIVALLFLKDIQEVLVHPEEGKVTVKDSSNFLIILAPYYLPIYTIPLIMIHPFIFYPIRIIIDFLIGFTLAFHYTALWKEFRRDQPDIERTGRIFAFSVVCILNTIFLVIILSVVSGNYSNILDYFQNSIARTPESYEAALQTLIILNDYKDQLLQRWLTSSEPY